MKPLHKQILTVALLMAPALVIPFVPGLSELLQYDRAAIAYGQHWRLITQHWCHWSMDHLLYDMIALVVLGFWAIRYSIKECLITVMTSAVTISIGMVLWQTDQLYIRGFSGIDCALFGMVLFHVVKQAVHERDRLWMIVAILSAIGFVSKTGYEIITQHTVFMDGDAAGMIPLPLTHLIGFVTAMAISLYRQGKFRLAKTLSEEPLPQ